METKEELQRQLASAESIAEKNRNNLKNAAAELQQYWRDIVAENDAEIIALKRKIELHQIASS